MPVPQIVEEKIGYPFSGRVTKKNSIEDYVVLKITDLRRITGSYGSLCIYDSEKLVADKRD